MAQTKNGALVRYCGHDAMFYADIYKIGTANVVRPNGPLTENILIRPATKKVTHHMVDFPAVGFWRPELGVFVVPEDQVREL